MALVAVAAVGLCVTLLATVSEKWSSASRTSARRRAFVAAERLSSPEAADRLVSLIDDSRTLALANEHPRLSMRVLPMSRPPFSDERDALVVRLLKQPDHEGVRALRHAEAYPWLSLLGDSDSLPAMRDAVLAAKSWMEKAEREKRQGERGKTEEREAANADLFFVCHSMALLGSESALETVRKHCPEEGKERAEELWQFAAEARRQLDTARDLKDFCEALRTRFEKSFRAQFDSPPNIPGIPVDDCAFRWPRGIVVCLCAMASPDAKFPRTFPTAEEMLALVASTMWSASHPDARIEVPETFTRQGMQSVGLVYRLSSWLIFAALVGVLGVITHAGHRNEGSGVKDWRQTFVEASILCALEFLLIFLDVEQRSSGIPSAWGQLLLVIMIAPIFLGWGTVSLLMLLTDFREGITRLFTFGFGAVWGISLVFQAADVLQPVTHGIALSPAEYMLGASTGGCLGILIHDLVGVLITGRNARVVVRERMIEFGSGYAGILLACFLLLVLPQGPVSVAQDAAILLAVGVFIYQWWTARSS